MKKNFFAFLVLFYSITIAFAGANKTVTPETALQSYLNNGDKSFQWDVQEKFDAGDVTLYRLIFTSQTWRNIKWKHELTVIVPEDLKYQDALLFITGGSVKNGEPNIHTWDKGEIVSFSEVAKKNKAIVAIVWQIPNQPLYDNLTEDALISYTFHHYQKDHDLTWPLLFPMTKSAVRAMDAIQEFAEKELKTKVNEFVVSGASKRGWTTWLTGASDKRVKAIGPMVIDVLNMPVNVDYHKVTWGDYSIQIQDYVDLGIAQQMDTPGGRNLVQMVDPYSYRKKLTMPKMIFMGTNDEYWPVDAIKNYIDSIPGDNHICYVPNAGHDLGDKKKAFAALSAFFGTAITDEEYPDCDYSITQEDGKITLTVRATANVLEDVILWSADSEDRDFRDEKWTDKSLKIKNKSEFSVEVDYPDSGFKAFYIDLKYKAPFGGEYTQSTRMYVAKNSQLLLKGD
ncbi:MAG: PhoPQ-activated pathogenicity-related family protein [Mangrovibacterium sp.]